MSNFHVLDLGNGDFKAGSNMRKEIEVFPAIVGQLGSYTNLELGMGGKRTENMSIRKEGREHAIGKMALKNSNIRNHDVTEDKYISPDTMLLSHTAFSLTSDHAYTSTNVILGLPLHKMSIARQVINMYQGKQFGAQLGYYGQYETTIRNVQVLKTLAVAQPHGTLFNLILDDKGEIANKELAQSGVAIFDIGYKTNDGVVFKNLEPIGRLNVHSKNGMHIAYEQIRQRINHSFSGVELRTFEMPEVIKTGQVRGNDVSEVIGDAFYDLASNILLELKARWDDAWEIENMVFTGGGAELLKPYIIQAYDAIFPENCQTSNAEGMLKYAKRLWGRGVA